METTMQTPSGQMTAPRLRTLLQDGTLAGKWDLDPGKSGIKLKSKSLWGLVPVKGVFREVSGNGAITPDGKISGTLTVATASIDTKQARRDTHLRSADLFDSENNPEITFTAGDIRLTDQGAAVTGALTVRGRTRPLSIDTVASLQGDGELWLDAEVSVNRADFGMTWNVLGMSSLHSTLTIHAVFTRR
jgi:polyisoprenoid-binding protein YceI